MYSKSVTGGRDRRSRPIAHDYSTITCAKRTESEQEASTSGNDSGEFVAYVRSD